LGGEKKEYRERRGSGEWRHQVKEGKQEVEEEEEGRK
jgi:hypothetical protein